MEAIFHTPIPPVVKFIVVKGNANKGNIGSRPINISDSAPATPAGINAAKLVFFIFNSQFALLIVILMTNDPINAIIGMRIGIRINAF